MKIDSPKSSESLPGEGPSSTEQRPRPPQESEDTQSDTNDTSFQSHILHLYGEEHALRGAAAVQRLDQH